MLNANGDPARFRHFGLPVAADVVEGFAGPLAGVLTGMTWARAERPDLPWIATIATDTPFFPRDLVARLLAALERDGADLACAASAGRAHPVFGLWPVRLAADLRRAMVADGVRKVDVWTARYRLVQVDFPARPVDPFFNANAPDDLAAGRAPAGKPGTGPKAPSSSGRRALQRRALRLMPPTAPRAAPAPRAARSGGRPARGRSRAGPRRRLARAPRPLPPPASRSTDRP